MATRSAIGYKTPQGKIRAIYCHYDGYPVGVGHTLETHYQAAYKIGQLVELGDASTLGAQVRGDSTHSFDTPNDDVTVFYARDRGETRVDTKEFETVGDFVEYFAGSGCEYFYLRSGDAWIYHDRYNVGKDANGFPVFDLLEPAVNAAIDRLRKMGYI